MAYLNISTPIIKAYIRKKYMANLDENESGVLPCIVFGMHSLPSETPLFHIMTEDGAVWWKAPIHALCTKEDAPERELADLCLWNSFSYYPSITCFDYLCGMRMRYADRSKKEHLGTYLFTIDWAHEDGTIPDLGFSEIPEEHKCGHVIELDDGNIAIQPNNRVRFFDPSFATKSDGEPLMKRKPNTHFWSSEHTSKWKAEDSDNFDYDIVTLDKTTQNQADEQ